MAKPAPPEKCIVCSKTVYAMEKVSVEGKVFHEGCFKCAQCKKKLSPGTYTGIENTYYCKPHYTQIFTSKGNYSDGFGLEKPTANWAPSTATFEGSDTKKPAGASAPVASTHAKAPEPHHEAAPKPPGPPGPPPPAPPPVDFTVVAPAGQDDPGAHAAALAAIASGEHKLKHVSREDRKRKPASSVVPDAKPKPAAEAPVHAKGFSIRKGTPELKLDGLKWMVKFYPGQEEPVTINITDKKQSVTISDCSKTIFVIKGKVTNISVMNSESCGVIFDDIIASVEVVRCQKMQLQSNGQIAQICIDKTNGADLFIQTEAGKNVEIVTSLTDAVNINFPGKSEEEDMVEFPIPAQFQSVLENGKLVTTAVSHV